MGDLNEEFTKDELVTLGEVDEDEDLDTDEGEEEQEGSEGEKHQEAEGEDEGHEEEKAGEAEGEEEAEAAEGEEEAEGGAEEKTSVQKRIDEVVAKQKTQERELDFYRVKAGEMTRDEYFDKHGVYPATKDEAEEKDTRGLKVSDSDIWDMVIKGGDFDGERLGDVHDEGGAKARYALDLYNKERDRRRDEALEQERSESERLRESEQELYAFANTISQQMFEKTADKITETEGQQVNAVIQETLDWMKETKRGFSNIEDAYRLKNFDKLISDAEERGAKGLIKATDGRKTTPTVSSKQDQGEVTGFARYEQMTPEQLADVVDGMTDGQYQNFIKKAPKSLRQKFPGIEWEQ